MYCCLDVDYRSAACAAAGLLFQRWTDEVAALELTLIHPEPPAEYEPGHFYLRELPHLLRLLAQLPALPSLVIVDGFAFLEGETPGLGAHLHRALGEQVPVIGVAKRPYRRATSAVPVLRGESQVPLWVSAAGYPVDQAAAALASMHGAHRIPTLLRRVDRLARDAT